MVSYIAVKESQVFIANNHAAFFSMYCPPPSQRDVVRRPGVSYGGPQIHQPRCTCLSAANVGKESSRVRPQIANACITLNEFPFIRYYAPSHHAPLGVLAPQYSESSTSSSSSSAEPYAPRQPASRYQPASGPSTSSLALGSYGESTSKWAAKLSSRAGSSAANLLARSYGADNGSGQDTGDHVSKVLRRWCLRRWRSTRRRTLIGPGRIRYAHDRAI